MALRPWQSASYTGEERAILEAALTAALAILESAGTCAVIPLEERRERAAWAIHDQARQSIFDPKRLRGAALTTMDRRLSGAGSALG